MLRISVAGGEALPAGRQAHPDTSRVLTLVLKKTPTYGRVFCGRTRARTLDLLGVNEAL